MGTNRSYEKLKQHNENLQRELNRLKKQNEQLQHKLYNDNHNQIIKKYELIFDQSPLGLILYDQDGIITKCNTAFLNIIGASKNELIGLNMLKLPDKRVVKSVKKTLHSLQTSEIEINYTTTTTNRKIPVRVHFSPLVTNNNCVHGGIGIIEDITKQKNIEKKLKQKKESFKTTLNSIGDAVISTDIEGNVLYMNLVAQRLTGYSVADARGRPVGDIFEIYNYKTNEPIGNPVKKVIETGRVVGLANHTVLVSKNDQEYHISDSGCPIKNEKGEITGAVLVFRDVSDEYRMQEALYKSEKKYKAVFENTGTATVIIEGDGTVSLANNKFAEMADNSLENIINKIKWPEYVVKDDHEKMWEQHRLRREDRNKALREYEFRFKDNSGRIKNIFATIDMIPGTKKSVASLLDITEWKRVKKNLKEREEQLSTLLDASPDIICFKDGEGKWMHANKSILNLFSLNQADYKNKSSYDLIDCINKISSSALKAFDKTDEIAWNKGSITRNEEVIDQPDGKRRIYDMIRVPIYKNNGDRKGLLVFGRDITKLKETEKELAQFFEINLDLLCIADTKGNFIKVNKAWENLLGYPVEEIEQAKFLDFVHPDDLENTINEMNKLKNQEKVLNFVNRFQCKDGSYRYIEWRSNSVGDTIFAAARDITERIEDEKEKKRLREELLQAQKLESIGTLAGGVAHDFNNILTVIIGLTQLVMNKTGKTNPIYSNLESIFGAAERAAKLTEQLLLFSRKQEMSFQTTNLNKTISRLEKMLRRLIGEDITMHNSFQEDLWWIKADEGQIEQVITNLVVNARDAMPEGGDLYINTQNVTIDEEKAQILHDIEPGKYVRFDIEDTGHGIDEKTQNKIFDPFFTTKGRAKGTGMGLSVVHGIIKKHKGLITVHSIPDHGAIFRVYLPAIDKKDSEDKQIIKENIKKYQGEGETILLVEDEEPVLDFLKNILDNYNYLYFSAESAEKANQIFQRNKDNIDLVVSDVIMSGMNGVELADQLKEQKKDLKIILGSGYSDSKVAPEKIREKGYNFIQKPYDVLQLLKMIHKTLN